MYTIEQYNALVSAITTGSKTVRYGDKLVEYRSLTEMLEIKKLMEGVLFPPTDSIGGQPLNRRVAAFYKGL